MAEDNVMLNESAASLGIEYKCNFRGGWVPNHNPNPNPNPNPNANTNPNTNADPDPSPNPTRRP